MNDPSVSVIITCFNQEDLITRTIESVLGQTAIGDIREIIVVDDRSTDGSTYVVSELAEAHPKLRLITHTENSGAPAAPRNTGIAASTGQFVSFLDGDDIWLPRKTEIDLETFKAHPDAGLVYHDYIEVHGNDAGRRIYANRYAVRDGLCMERFFVHGGPIPPSVATVRRDVLEAVGVFNEDYKFNEDAELWLRISEAFPLQHSGCAEVKKIELEGSLGSVKHGLANLEAKRQITRDALAREPRLRPHARARNAQIEFRAAVHHFTANEVVHARRHLRQAIRLRPSFAKAWGYTALSYLPEQSERALDMVRRTRSRVLNRVR